MHTNLKYQVDLTELISSAYLLFLLPLLINSVNSWEIHTLAPWQIDFTAD